MRRDEYWDRNYELLKEYIELFGGIPSRNVVYKGMNIGIWVNSKRSIYFNGTRSDCL